MYDCIDLKLPNGAVMNGKLNYDKNGQAFVKRGETVDIEGVKIDNSEWKGRGGVSLGDKANVVFNGKKCEGRCVSFDFNKKTLVITTTKLQSPKIEFKENNPFIQIDKGDYVAMTSLLDGEIKIQNRDELGLIPEVTTKGSFIIDEDSKSISAMGLGVRLNSFPILNKKDLSAPHTTTSPIEIVMLDNEGQSLSGKFNNIMEIKGNKIIVDNANRIGIGIEAKEEFISSSEGVETKDIKFSARVNYNYPTEKNIEKLTETDIKFYGISKGNKDRALGRFRDYFATLTPEIQNSITSVEFASDNYFEKVLGMEKSANAFATIEGRIVFRENEKYNKKAFQHEAAHIHHYEIRKNNLNEEGRMKLEENTKKYISNRKRMEKISQDILSIDNPIKRVELAKELAKLQDEDKKTDTEYQKITQDSPFDKEWRTLYETCESGKCFVRYYGGTKMVEDIATFNEITPTNPEIFSCSINPQCYLYHPVFKQKIDLLYKYQFKSKEWYDEVLSFAKEK
jgi:hypothetical protein